MFAIIFSARIFNTKSKCKELLSGNAEAKKEKGQCNQADYLIAGSIILMLITIPWTIYSVLIVRRHHLVLLGGGKFFQLSLGIKSKNSGNVQAQNVEAGQPQNADAASVPVGDAEPSTPVDLTPAEGASQAQNVGASQAQNVSAAQPDVSAPPEAV